MATCLDLFNPVEVQDYFVEKLDALITFACDLVRGAVFFFIAHLISLQYRKELRINLIQRMKENAYTSSTIQQRKNFITFCVESAQVNTLERDGIFEKVFFPFYLKLGYQEHNYAVQLHLIRSLPVVRSAIVRSGDVTGHLKLNQMISDMKDNREGMLPDAFDKLCDTSLMFRSDAEIARVSAMPDIDTNAKRLQGNIHLEELNKREEFEATALKKMIQERELKRKRRAIIDQMESKGTKVEDSIRTRSLDRRVVDDQNTPGSLRLAA